VVGLLEPITIWVLKAVESGLAICSGNYNVVLVNGEMQWLTLWREMVPGYSV
jgi:hypothetical protein